VLLGVLVGALTIGALIGQVLLSPLRLLSLPSWALRTFGIGFAIAELLYLRRGKPRPFSVNRQVPQTWGYVHGPWKAAVRYGVRMGFGPATMLNTWTWWFGAIAAASVGWTACIVFAVVFALTRGVLTVFIPGAPSDGIALSAQMARWRRIEPRLRIVGPVVIVFTAQLFLR
jgi:hypothetical protein